MTARASARFACLVILVAAALSPVRARAANARLAKPAKPNGAAPSLGLLADEPYLPTLTMPIDLPTASLKSRPARRGPGNVIHESIFGPASKSNWQPLTLGSFFTEGWDRRFVNAPDGTNGAPKQLWLNAPLGVFGRFMHTDFVYTNGLRDVPGLLLNGEPWSASHPKHATGNDYMGVYNILVPLNSRLEIQIIAPFITSNKTYPTGNYAGNFGDLSFQARFHLIDQRSYSVVAFLGERTPTGFSANGNNINFISPSLEGWWNFAPKWVMRGGTGINIRTNHIDSNADVYFNRLALGRYVTGKDALIFKDLALYGAATVLSDVTGQSNYVTDVYLGPGMRFGMGKDQKLAVSFAVQAPVTGPQSYSWQPSFSALYKY